MTTLEYHRPARDNVKGPTPKTITIQAPPSLPPKSSGAWLQMIVPAVGILGSFSFIFYAKISPVTLLATGAMLLASVGGGLLVRVQQARFQKQRLRQSRAKYQEYLADLRRSLVRDAQAQRQLAETLYPAPQTLLTLREGGGRVPQRLWERRWTDADFMEARVGTGFVPLCHTLVTPTHAATALDIDTEMDEAAHALKSDFQVLPDMPFRVELRRAGSVAICGAAEARRDLARAMLIGLAFNHAPGDLRILLYAPRPAMESWTWLKWFPHTRALRRTESSSAAEPERLCMLADNVTDLARLLEDQVKPEFERRSKAWEDHHDGKVALPPPHFLIVIDEYSPYGEVARLSTLSQILDRVTTEANQPDSPGVGITVLTLADSHDTAPSVLYGRFEILGSGMMSYRESHQGGNQVEAIHPDRIAPEQCEEMARVLTPVTLTSSGADVDLSREVRLLPLLGFSSPDAIDTSLLWQPRTPSQMMVVPVGICEDGTQLVLNLREPAEQGIGPHGMLIGQPGMGKTGFLQTLLLGLAMTHSHEEVTFVVIDYKGDVDFRDLATLPHCVGHVTRVKEDSSGDMVKRLHQSLEGERARRAAVLGAAQVNKISAYHALRRTRPNMPPLPYLVIVVDEYAALLRDHSDLKDFFTEIGEQGRFIGMNMILASQSPSGGNLQQLETYLSYRVCVRTANAADSKAALGTSDAYYLPNFIPGLAYLKAGEHYYHKFRSALATAPYQRDSQLPQGALQIRELDPVGMLVPLGAMGAMPGAVEQAHDAADAAAGDPPPPELSVAVQRLLAAAKEREWERPHQVWVPPLPRVVTLGQVCDEAQVDLLRGPTDRAGTGAIALSRVPLGVVDHVHEQRQIPFLYDFTGHGGHLSIVGAPTTGASTLLKTILAALIATTTPSDAQLYVIDAGGGRLDGFGHAPHVGRVCGGGDAEVVRRMVSQVKSLVDRREQRFRRERIGGIGALRDQRATLPPDGDDIGADVFLVIDNLNALRTEAEQGGYAGELMSDLAAIAGTGLTYGVHLILTAQNQPPAQLVDKIRGRIELRLNDPRASNMGRAADGTNAAFLVEEGIPGRGLVAGPYLFQAALPHLDANARSVEALTKSSPAQIEQRCDQQVTALAERARQQWKGPGAPPVRLLPRMLHESDLAGMDAQPSTGFVLGLEEATFQPLTLDLTRTGPHLLVYGDLQHGKSALLRLMIAQLARLYTPEEARFVLLDPRRGLVSCTSSPSMLRSGDLFGYACTKEMIEDCVVLLKQHLDTRKASSGRLTLDELRVGKSWAGPRIFVFFDDYEPNGVLGAGPLNPFGEFVQQVSDIGFHLVVTRQLADGNRVGTDQTVLDRIKNGGSPLLVMGSDTQGLVPGGLGRGKLLPAGRAFLVRRSAPVAIVQIAYTPPVA